MKRESLFILTLLLIYFSLSLPAGAGPKASHAVSESVDDLTKAMRKDIKSQKKEFGRSAVFIEVDDDIDYDLKPYLQKKVETLLTDSKKAQPVQCFQCEALRGYSDGNQLIIEKGISDKQIATQIAQSLSLDTFFHIHLFYSGKRLKILAKATSASTQEVLWQEEYASYLTSLEDKGLILSLEVGSAYIRTKNSTDDNLGMTVGAMVGERFHGLGRAGLGISSVFSLANPSFNQAYGPYFSVNINEVTGHYLSWGDFSIFANPSYALSQDSLGFLARGGVTFSLGKFVHFGAEYQKPVYSRNPDKKYPESIIFKIGYDIF